MINLFKVCFIFLLIIAINMCIIPSAKAAGIEKILELKGYHKTDYFDIKAESEYYRLYRDKDNPHYNKTSDNGDEVQLIPVELNAGTSYVFTGYLAEYDCFSMEISIFDNQGNMITASEGYTGNPFVQFTPEKADIYNIAVSTPSHTRNVGECQFYITEYN